MQAPADIAPHLEALERSVGTRAFDDQEAQLVAVERTINAPIEQVWQALTKPARLPRWFLPIDGQLELGGRFALAGNASGKILRCDAPLRFEVTWEFGEDRSRVKVELTDQGETSTRIRLEHLGHVAAEFANTYGPGAGGVGWDLTLMGLAEHLAGAPDIDPADAAQWPTTTQGQAFVKRSATAWGHAAIEAGADPTQANAAAARTFAFYTGQNPDEGSHDA